MDQPPVPVARSRPPGVQELVKPVPKPRQHIQKDPSNNGGSAPPVAPRRLMTPPSNSSDKPQDNKRSSKDSTSATKNKIEEVIMIGANIATKMFEQGQNPKRNSKIESKSNNLFKTRPVPLIKSERPNSTPSDVALFATIKFHSPIIEEQDKFTYNHQSYESIYNVPVEAKTKEKNSDLKKRIMIEENSNIESMLSMSEESYESIQIASASETAVKIANTSLDIDQCSISDRSPNSNVNDLPSTSTNDSLITNKKSAIESTSNKTSPLPPAKPRKQLKIHTTPVEENSSITENEDPQPRKKVIFSGFGKEKNPHCTSISETLNDKPLTPQPFQKSIPSTSQRPSNSTIFEFDPLQQNNNVVADKRNEFLLMNSLLGDNYNRLQSIDDDLSNEVDFDLYMDNLECNLAAPLPPERFDSLNDISTPPPPYTPRESKTLWHFDESNMDVPEPKRKFADSLKQSNIKIKKTFSFFKRSSSETVSNIRRKFDDKSSVASNIGKPTLRNNTTYHEGLMTRLLSGAIDELFKNYQMRRCTLKQNTITCYSDNTTSISKDVYNLENLFSIQVIFSNNLDSQIELDCFKMTFKSSGTFNNNRTSVVFGCSSKNERNIWILKIMECITDIFPQNFLIDMTRFGWAYIKENVSRDWQSGWLLLCRRALYYWTPQEEKMQYLDLRKARCVVLQKDEDNTTEEGPNVILDFPDQTFYMKMGHSEETKVWRKILYNVATGNGTWLYRQQLTQDDIPTLVIKCINFVYTEGSLTEFIYRRTGAVTAVTSILEEFKKDAWAVQLSPRTHNPYDVATALKRFFRELPEAILAPDIQELLCTTSDLKRVEDKVLNYQKLLKQLHPISQNTLKKLLGHLHFIQSLSNENHMTADNLAAIWGPALIYYNVDNPSNDYIREISVVRDLIKLYIPIYNPSEDELKKEKQMQSILFKYQNSNLNMPTKQTGDFHIWIYVERKSPETSINIVLRPGMTAASLCAEHSLKLKKESCDLVVEEVICSEGLRRPIHHSEVLLNVVFRWGYWDEMDRKDNYLMIADNTLLRQISQSITAPIGQQYFNKELKYASEKTKSFKLFTFHFSQGVLTCFKDKFGNVILNSWRMEDIIWYIGHEPKRNPQAQWSITIIPRTSKAVRTKDKPNFGSIVAGNDRNDYIRLMGMMMYAEHGGNILPKVQLIVP